ncbi:proline-rich protein HaeIII subfamily 1-like [Acinonyx jubatus]|uniref:Proline-rich protein HaeIII subfamily 1-like n=1 Tax=Acinonyx jubatus TaxID=32536 RepID=A0ABM3N846_ACIJB|nr:proline-rich protein HaeIII subfamily 1-like [Acinonyx jubatus]
MCYIQAEKWLNARALREVRTSHPGVSNRAQAAATCRGKPPGVSPPSTVAASSGRRAQQPRSLPAPSGPRPFTSPPSHRNSQPPPFFPSPSGLPPGIIFEEAGESRRRWAQHSNPAGTPAVARPPAARPPLRAPERDRGLAPVRAEKPVGLRGPRRSPARPSGFPGRTDPRASPAAPERSAGRSGGPRGLRATKLCGPLGLRPHGTTREAPEASGPPLSAPRPSPPRRPPDHFCAPPFPFRPPSVTGG